MNEPFTIEQLDHAFEEVAKLRASRTVALGPLGEAPLEDIPVCWLEKLEGSYLIQCFITTCGILGPRLATFVLLHQAVLTGMRLEQNRQLAEALRTELTERIGGR